MAAYPRPSLEGQRQPDRRRGRAGIRSEDQVCAPGTAPCPTVIVATIDGGAHWRPRSAGLDTFGNVTFPSLHLAVATAHGDILRSTDGARTWSTVFHTPACAFSSLSFPDGRHGWATGVGPLGPCLYRTTDGGGTWQPLFDRLDSGPAATAFARYRQTLGRFAPGASALEDAHNSAPSVQFTSLQDGWFIARFWAFDPGAFAVLHTTDGGVTWTYAWGSSGCLMGCEGMGGSMAPLQFVGDVAWRPAPRGVARSQDGGQTWAIGAALCPQAQCVPTLSFLDAVHG